jgi:hypothetical protein
MAQAERTGAPGLSAEPNAMGPWPMSRDYSTRGPALSGLKNGGLGPEDVLLDDEPDARRDDPYI